ncbi:nucleotidyltransferase [candidate division WOR-3 bacterium]|nr:nucleotidyltransferase [candidate division WOR-3 bacterium]
MFKKLILGLAQSFQKNGIPYIIIGGQAVLIYGEPRMTNDIDVTLGVDTNEIQNILAITGDLELKCLVDHPSEFVNKTMVLPLIDPVTAIKIDLIFSNSEFEKKAIERAKRIIIDGISVNYASLEDLLIFKIFSGRPRDIEDAKNILLKNPVFDMGYIEKQLNEFDKALALNLLKTFQKLLMEIKRGQSPPF